LIGPDQHHAIHLLVMSEHPIGCPCGATRSGSGAARRSRPGSTQGLL